MNATVNTWRPRSESAPGMPLDPKQEIQATLTREEVEALSMDFPNEYRNPDNYWERWEALRAARESGRAKLAALHAPETEG